MTPRFDLGAPVDTATDRSPPGPIGTWTIDHATSSVALAWRGLRLRTVTGRLHCLGIIHLDDLPPVGVVRFEQPSRLPTLTMALDPAAVTGHRWWTLRSESLEVLPTGTWRVMATLTTHGTATLVDLRFEIQASHPDRLVLRGRGALDRRALGLARPPSIRNQRVRLDLELHARRVVTDRSLDRQNQAKGTPVRASTAGLAG
jgi:hypothetical protein